MGQGSDLLGVTGNESPGNQMLPGLPATQLTSTLRTLHRRNLEKSVVNVWLWRYWRALAAKQWNCASSFHRLRHHNQYRPMLGRSRHASELQALLGVIDDILLLWLEP